MYFPKVTAIGLNMSNYGAMRTTFDFKQNTCINVDVSMFRLDDMFPDNKIDFIKIDSEGCDVDVVRGAKNIIKRCKPYILFENHNILDEMMIELDEFHYRFEKVGVENVFAIPYIDLL